LNTPIKYSPLANDLVPPGSKITSINGTPVVIGTPITVPNGTVVVNADGTITFTPVTGYVGSSVFPYEVTTPNGTIVKANDTITITGEGKIEIIKTGIFNDTNANGAAEVGETIKYTFTVKNAGALALTAVSVTDNKCSPVLGGPINLGVGASDSTTFTCIYTLTAADIVAGKVDNSATAKGTDPTGKIVTDISDSTDPAKPGLDDPTTTLLPVKAVDDTKSTGVNVPVTYAPLANDLVPTGSTITKINGVTPVVGTPVLVPNGTVTLNADNTFTFTPNPGYVGSSSFPYEVTTPSGTKVTANDTITIVGDAKLELIKSSTLVDTNGNGYTDLGDKLKYVFSVKNTGSLVVSNITITDNKCSPVTNSPIASLPVGAVNSTPTCDYTLTAADIALGKVENTATAAGTDPTGKPVNDVSDDGNNPNNPGGDNPTISLLIPKAIDDTKVTPLNTPITYSPLVNDIVPTGSKITLINGTPATVGTPITVPNGTATLNTDGSVTFTPTTEYVGSSTFPYEVTTPAGVKVTANDTIKITGEGKIELIKAGTLNDTNADGAAQAGETIKYTFTVKNAGALALTAVTVTDNKCSPVLGGPIALAVGASDTTTFTCTYTLTTADITLGKVDNSATVTAKDPTGKTVIDVSDSTDPAKPGLDDPTVTLLPVKAVDDTKVTKVNTPVTYSPLANDLVPPASKITSINSTPVVVGTPITVPNGTVTVNADQSVTFTPAPGYVGSTSFPYEVTTPSGTVTKAIDTITIVDVPKLVDDTKQTPVNTPVTYAPMANDPVPTGSSITKINGITVIPGTPIVVPNGTVVVNNDNTVTFTPTTGFTGSTTFPYEVTTPDGAMVSAIDTITIVDVPKAVDDIKQTPYNTPVTYSPLANDSVPVGSKITSINGIPVVVGTPIVVPNGTVVVNADNSVIFTPNPGFSGTSAFPYEVTTPTGTIVKAIDTITVAPPAPVVVDDMKVTSLNTPITYCPLANDIVPMGSKITMINGIPVTVGTPIKVLYGTVVVNADGCITVTPDKDYVGDIKFPYEVTTPSGTKVTANDTVTVNGKGQVELDKAATYTDANGDGKLSLGETVKYAFTIKNSGNTTLTNVSVTDTLPGIVMMGTPIPTMSPGAINTTAYYATYIVTQADLDNGMVINQATVQGTDPQGNVVKDLSNDPSTSNPNDPTALAVTKPPVPCAVCPPAPTPAPTCSNCPSPCAGQSGCNTGCNTGCCTPINSISNVTNTNNVTITGGSAPMIAPVYNYNNVFNSKIDFTQGPITFDFSPVTNNYYGPKS
jgi:Bacterial Ig domain